MGHSILAGAIYLVAFVSSCAVLRPCFPYPNDADVRAKIEYLEHHGDDFDVLFIGSSRVHQQIIPAIFDRAASPVRSFNAGLTAMFSPEEGYVLEQILRGPHRRLRWVFVELMALDTDTLGERTSRFAYWHDTPRLVLIARALYAEALVELAKDSRAAFSTKCQIWTMMAGKFRVHLAAWLTRETNLDLGSEILNRWLHLRGWHFKPQESLGENGDGWVPAAPAYQNMTGDVREKYEQAYAARLAQPAAKIPADPISQMAIDRSADAITRAGAHPIFLIPPMATEQVIYPTGRNFLVLDFSDVRKYPELFVPEHRTDIGHVNTAGAKIFSEILRRVFISDAKAP